MTISPLAQLLKKAIVRQLDYRVAIAFSGGLDSATIATVAKENVETHLITMGLAGSHDLIAAKETAKALDLPLQIIELDAARIEKTYRHCWELMQGSLTEVELMVGTWEVCAAAKEAGFATILFGSGAEEVFIGYNRYYEALERKEDIEALLKEELCTLPSRDLMRTREIAKHFGLEARFPFLDEELVNAVGKLPLESKLGTMKMKKPLLRALALELGVPECARLRPKKAMQYGSGIHVTARTLWREGKISAQEPEKPNQ